MEREQSVLSHAQAKHFYDHFGVNNALPAC